MLDLAAVRRSFPAFSEPSLEGWAFFENAGGSYTCGPVIDRLTSYYRETKVQPYYPYPASTRAGEWMDESYERLAGYLGMEPDEIDLGPSTSQNTYVLAQAFRQSLDDGDEVIVTNQDHEANSGAWRRLAATGLNVREWSVDPVTGLLDPADLDELMTDRTRLVVFPHCSNVVAHLNPVADITKRIKAANGDVRVVVDGVSAAPHGFPDVASLGVDIYLFSLYKTFGPHLGLMAATRDVRSQLPNQSHFFNAEATHKPLVPAGPDHAQIAAAAGIADYFDSLHAHHFPSETVSPLQRGQQIAELFRSAELPLLDRLLGWLRDRDDVSIIGPDHGAERAATVSIVPHRRPINDVLADLVRHQIMAGDGDFYAVRPLEAMGVKLPTGVLRLSFVHYTSAADVEQLIDALDKSL